LLWEIFTKKIFSSTGNEIFYMKRGSYLIIPVFSVYIRNYR